MTPQERQRVADLFERLAKLESAPRDREAEQLIAEGLHYVPNAPYALIQTVLLQEEALKRANERIAEMEGADGSEPAQSGGGFLDSLRGALTGQPAAPRRGSVPSTRGGNSPIGVPPGFRQGAAPAAEQQQQVGRGGSFLGQAASIAAGVVVGSMVADALRGHFGSDAGKESASEQQAAAEQDTHQQADADTGGYEGDSGQYDTADLGGDFGGGDFGGDFG